MKDEKDICEIMKETINLWCKDTEQKYRNFLYGNNQLLEHLKRFSPHPPEEQKTKKEPRWFAYFNDGYDSQWMKSYHTKKEAVSDIKIHRDSFECLIKGKIVK